ncbi:MAG: DNA-directed RNA polymerase subunit omega [Flavobacteriales bacterium]|nr:DNA-directed RNA polymerase subunit omega [Flavobacteriales bacterium]
MEFKKTGAEQTTITRDVKNIVDKTGNIYKSLAVLAKRSEQLNERMKAELLAKLNEFATHSDELEEVFENSEQIEVSKFYERLPKPWAIAVKELLADQVYIRDADKVEDENPVAQSEKKDA